MKLPIFKLAVAVPLLLATACGGAVAPASVAPAAPSSAAPASQAAASPVASFGPQYVAPVPLQPAAQAGFTNFLYKAGAKPRIAYMPPATEFNYYMAIGEGIKAQAATLGADTFLLAPQSGSDINGQMGLLQDVITQKVDAIILSTHDEQAAAPLVKKAVDQGTAVIIVNSDIADFPAPVHAVVGYKQRKGTHMEGDYAIKLVAGKPQVVGLLEGQPGYHSTERVGGFVDAITGQPNFKIVASLPTNWNTDGGNAAAMDMLQAHPDVTMIFAANDYEILRRSGGESPGQDRHPELRQRR